LTEILNHSIAPRQGLKHKISSLLPTLRINQSEFHFRSELFLTEFVILKLNSKMN